MRFKIEYKIIFDASEYGLNNNASFDEAFYIDASYGF